MGKVPTHMHMNYIVNNDICMIPPYTYICIYALMYLCMYEYICIYIYLLIQNSFITPSIRILLLRKHWLTGEEQTTTTTEKKTNDRVLNTWEWVIGRGSTLSCATTAR